MARIHHLFFSSDSERVTLHRQIVPTDEQRDAQKGAWEDVAKYLIAELSEKTALPVYTLLQGSYRLHTQVRPHSLLGSFDIDLGLYFEWSVGSPFGAKELKDLVQETLGRYAAEAGESVKALPSKESCCRIQFPGNFHIDVPVYRVDAGATPLLATESSGWKESDPQAFRDWFLAQFSDEENTLVRRLVRYLKMWAALHLPNPPSSMALMVLVGEAVKALPAERLDGDDVGLGSVADAILQRMRANYLIQNPVDHAENLNRMSSAAQAEFLEGLLNLAARGRSSESAATEADAAKVWTDAYYHFFPPIESAPERSVALVPVSFVPKIRVRAVARGNTHFVREGDGSIGPIPKDCDVSFTLTNAQMLPADASVQWMVRNGGEEASYVNDLGHLSLGKNFVAEERSAYVGTHFMDVVVTRPAMGVIGAARVPVKVDGYRVPPRNPRRPGYTRIPRRR